jgi:hypothetical protein
MGKRTLSSVGVLVGAMALFVLFCSPASAQTNARADTRQRAEVPSDVVVRDVHIALLKFALKLRPAQEPYWAPVEAALRDMAHWQAKGSPEVDANGRAGSSVAYRLRKIAAMAVPLIKALDEDQRRSMMMLARTAGLEMLVASR